MIVGDGVVVSPDHPQRCSKDRAGGDSGDISVGAGPVRDVPH